MTNEAKLHISRPAPQANPTTLFEDNPHERTRYDLLKARLLEQILPEGELELQTFERYVFACYQCERARKNEFDAELRWANEPDREIWFHQMERLKKLGALLERRADKALTELKRLQRDRFSALDVANELYLLDHYIPIPATLPIADIRRTNQTQTSPSQIAMQLLLNTPESMAILKGEVQAKPVEPIKLTPEALLDLHLQNRQ